MTLKEVEKVISESANREWFEKYEIAINYPHLKENFTITGVAAIYGFILRQLDEFDKYQNMPPELATSKTFFNQAKDTVINFLKVQNIYKNQWDNGLVSITRQNPPVFLFDAPETEFLIKIYTEKQLYFNGAYEYVIGSTQHASSRDYWVGYLLAYEFLSKEFSELVSRKDLEKKSITKIRSDFENALSEAENHLTEHLAASNKKSAEYATSIDGFKKEREQEFYRWYDNALKNFEEFDNVSHKKITELENLYHEKLKLEAPARYWRKRAKKLMRQGGFWLAGLISTIAISLNILLVILTDISVGTLEKIFQNTGTAIKWSVIVITVISFLAYAIRTFAKLTFSSFHLARDAEEREQLTYVYLALQKEKGIDPTERHLIMQSLFSRADSGLLKDEGAPTMPGNILDKALAR